MGSLLQDSEGNNYAVFNEKGDIIYKSDKELFTLIYDDSICIGENHDNSVQIYNPKTKDKRKVYKMMEDKRIKYYTPADYTEGSELDKLVKTIIDTTASNEKLMAVHYINKQEQVSHNGQIDNKEDKEKEKLIMDLENSNSFKQTHSIISELKKIKNWTLEEKKQLKIIAEKNKQISYIMKDGDVASFYSSLE